MENKSTISNHPPTRKTISLYNKIEPPIIVHQEAITKLALIKGKPISIKKTVNKGKIGNIKNIKTHKK